MTLDEAITKLREDFLDDTEEPYRWADDTLVRYLNEAEEEACRRADLLIDDTTDSICVLDIVADTQRYTISPTILKVLSAYNITDGYPMYQIEKVSADDIYPDWKTEQLDSPQWFVLNENDTLDIVYIPTEDFTMTMSVSRMPINTSKGASDDFEIPSKFQNDLMYYAAYLALNFEDVNTRKRNEADKYLAIFTSKFGKRPSASTEMHRKRIPRLPSMTPVTQSFGFP